MKSPEERFESFEAFWPHYVREHAQRATRTWHFWGTTAAVGTLAAAAVFRKKSLLLLVPLFGYGPAWASHYFVEKNRPATFAHPLWSLRADFVMWKKTLLGTMDDELTIANASADAPGTAGGPDATRTRIAPLETPDDPAEEGVPQSSRRPLRKGIAR